MDARNGTALAMASQKRSVEIVALLIKHGADVRAGDDAAMRAAMKTASDYGDFHEARDIIIALLRQHGAQLPDSG